MSERPNETAPASAPSAFLPFLRAYMRHMVDDMSQLVKEHGLSMPQFAALQYLHAEAPRSVSEIAEHLNLSLATTSHLVDRLVGKDLLLRDEDPGDRRQKRIAPAPAGRALVAETHARAAATLETLLEGVTPAKRAAVERALADVVAELPAARDARAPGCAGPEASS
jgi:DNA-binding MarR family transcriptional regulator